MISLNDEESRALARLLTRNRWAALATARDDEPLASWVAVAHAGQANYLLHLSHLSLHTRYLLVNPQAGLAFSEPDVDAGRDPQTLVRVSLQGRVTTIARETAEYEQARQQYLSQLPLADLQFTLGDFYLMRFVPDSARVIPGFGRAHRLDTRALQQLFDRHE